MREVVITGKHERDSPSTEPGQAHCPKEQRVTFVAQNQQWPTKTEPYSYSHIVVDDEVQDSVMVGHFTWGHLAISSLATAPVDGIVGHFLLEHQWGHLLGQFSVAPLENRGFREVATDAFQSSSPDDFQFPRRTYDRNGPDADSPPCSVARASSRARPGDRAFRSAVEHQP